MDSHISIFYPASCFKSVPWNQKFRFFLSAYQPENLSSKPIAEHIQPNSRAMSKTGHTSTRIFRSLKNLFLQWKKMQVTMTDLVLQPYQCYMHGTKK